MLQQAIIVLWGETKRQKRPEHFSKHIFSSKMEMAELKNTVTKI